MFSFVVCMATHGCAGTRVDDFEVARQLLALADALLIAMTGYGSAKDLLAAKLAGFDEHLVKPVDLEVLRVWLQRRIQPL